MFSRRMPRQWAAWIACLAVVWQATCAQFVHAAPAASGLPPELRVVCSMRPDAESPAMPSGADVPSEPAPGTAFHCMSCCAGGDPILAQPPSGTPAPPAIRLATSGRATALLVDVSSTGPPRLRGPPATG
jgi:hypothetical protein